MTAPMRESARLRHKLVALKLPLTVNIVIHRANIERIDDLVAMALDAGASRVEIAHVQYWQIAS
jgi:pyrroloquinoline quinone biosynthesis protein E